MSKRPPSIVPSLSSTLHRVPVTVEHQKGAIGLCTPSIEPVTDSVSIISTNKRRYITGPVCLITPRFVPCLNVVSDSTFLA